MRTITFTAEDRQALAHDRYYHPDPRVQRTMEVLWLKSYGLSHGQIATYADVSRSTVQRYLDQYLEGGSTAPASMSLASAPERPVRSQGLLGGILLEAPGLLRPAGPGRHRAADWRP